MHGSKQALGHVRVLDLTRVLAGPWAAQILADLGADVIKIERPGGGDDTRSWGPPYLRNEEGVDTGESTYFLSANRGKRSMTIDISRPDGQALVRELARSSDVVIENYKVGQLKKYGLDFEALRAEKPDLIFCSVTGFGQDGPYAHRAGYDFIIQGMGGFMSITGERDDRPGGGPQKAGVAVSDLMTGTYATVAILAALVHRDRTGEGQWIDMALLDVQVAMLGNMATSYLASGKAPTRWGNAHPNIVPYQTFAASDGDIIVAVGNDGQFEKFVAAGNLSELGIDERFATNPERVRHREVLVPLLADMVATKTKREWADLLEAAGVPCGVVSNLQEVFENPQVRARGLGVDLPHPSGGVTRLVASPLKMSVTPPKYERPPPMLGQHTEELLSGLLGKSSQQISQLRQQGVV